MSKIYDQIEFIVLDFFHLYRKDKSKETRRKLAAMQRVLQLCHFLIYEPFSQKKLDEFIELFQEGKEGDVLTAKDIQQATEIMEKFHTIKNGRV